MLNEVIHGDCLEIIKTIPDASIDMILCDLPYGTTAISCKETNKNFIVIEKEKKYFDIINERIDKHNKLRDGEFSFENTSY